MKRITLSILFIFIFVASKAQYDTVLVQDFNTSCASSSGFPADWLDTNPITGTAPNGAWQCTPTNGRWSTPGMECTGVWGSPEAYHLDTSFLITPGLNLSSYPGNVYLQFDTRTSRINLGARLFIVAGTVDSSFGRTPLDTNNLTPSLTPVFTSGDSSDWVTHEVDLTSFKWANPLYVAFMYISTTTSGSTWYLDNIHTTIYPTSVQDIANNTLPVTITGNSTRSEIAFSYNTSAPGLYHLSVYDMIGHKIYGEDINTSSGKTNYTIKGLSLHSGMYLVKMGDGLIYGTAKTVIP